MTEQHPTTPSAADTHTADTHTADTHTADTHTAAHGIPIHGVPIKEVDAGAEGTPVFGEAVLALGSQTLYPSTQAAIAALQQALMTLCNEHLHYDVFFRTWEGRYLAAAFDVQLVALPPDQEQSLFLMEHHELLPTQEQYAGRYARLEAWYEATRAVEEARTRGAPAEELERVTTAATQRYDELRALDVWTAPLTSAPD